MTTLSTDTPHPAETELARLTTEADNSPLKRLFQQSTLAANAFLELDLPQRETILHPYLKKGDYGMIYAPRGVGKSWLALMLGKAISEGAAAGNHWHAPTPNTVLYLDAEMNLADLQSRCKELSIQSPMFQLLSHEQLFTQSEDNTSLNLTDTRQQQAILELCAEQKTSVLIIDNLSTAFRGLNENEADAWEMVSPWLLDLRRRGISVILVCHAGRNGQIRGTSKREDMAHWILALDEYDDKSEHTHAFKTRFTKCRNTTAANTPTLLWKMSHEHEAFIIETQEIDPYGQFIELVNGGIKSNKELCDELGKTKSTLSKWAKRAEKEGKIRIQNGNYLPA